MAGKIVKSGALIVHLRQTQLKPKSRAEGRLTPLSSLRSDAGSKHIMSKAGEQKHAAAIDYIYLCYRGYDRSWSWPVAANAIRVEPRGPSSSQRGALWQSRSGATIVSQLCLQATMSRVREGSLTGSGKCNKYQPGQQIPSKWIWISPVPRRAYRRLGTSSLWKTTGMTVIGRSVLTERRLEKIRKQPNSRRYSRDKS